ncbi:MAG: prepilin-type N-terminal cleavage/methylation domain-containing protein [Tenericutes bacterium]|nr:prepilin-type N-terminal cleavage/methylation domain-containing protein [Mycoplasmatota bacterium]
MKKTNKKGFTLIELLAVIVILGIILIIAIPSISAAILNARKNAYVDTAIQLVDGVRMAALSNPALLPSGAETTNVSISAIKLEKGSNSKSPFGNEYEPMSYVQITSSGEDYIYSICLMDNKGNGIINTTDNTPVKIVEGDTSQVKLGLTERCTTVTTIPNEALYGE